MTGINARPKRFAALLVLVGMASAYSAEPPLPPLPFSPKKVSAQKGAVKLTLEVANTKVREEDSLWVRVTLTNVGKLPLEVFDDVFADVEALASTSQPIHIEVFDEKFEEQQTRFLEEHQSIDEEKARCMKEYRRKHLDPALPIPKTLKPGESFSTPAFPEPGIRSYRVCSGESEPVMRPPYGEIPGWYWHPPGYKVRAVFRGGVTPDRVKSLTPKGRLYYEAGYDVDLHTDWIRIEAVQ